LRLGGPVFEQEANPERWAESVRASGYRAAYCPVSADAGQELIRAYAKAAQQADLIIAEVGAWSNPLSSDEAERAKAREYCKKQLALADEIGAVCCVNIAGSLGQRWDGQIPDILTRSTFDQIVEMVRDIIDTVKPRRTYYTLEPMPWMYPDSPDSYLELIRAVDRDSFAVHLDPVNMICSPQRYLNNAAFLQECFEKLGPYIKSCHAKDIVLSDRLTTHLDEVRPGLGYLDYRVFLREMQRLPADTPLMLEHLPKQEEYIQAAQYVRQIASQEGIEL
jgi:sugar phosphate isomerase/epimerase